MSSHTWWRTRDIIVDKSCCWRDRRVIGYPARSREGCGSGQSGQKRRRLIVADGEGSVCVAPVPVEPPSTAAPGLGCPSGNLSLRIDARKVVSWPHEKSLKIEDLDLVQRPRVAILCDGKPAPSSCSTRTASSGIARCSTTREMSRITARCLNLNRRRKAAGYDGKGRCSAARFKRLRESAGPVTSRRPRTISTSRPRQPGGKLKCQLNIVRHEFASMGVI
jgi:hypothetical protein